MFDGRVIHHDIKNRDHPYPIMFRGRMPGWTRHAMNAPHVDQFYLSACVGYAGTNGLNCAKAVRSRVAFNNIVRHGPAGRTYLTNEDGTRNYSEATQRDPFPWTYPPQDEGSSALGLMKWWKEIGIIRGYTWTFTFSQFLAALTRQPVLVGTDWYDSMMSTGPSGLIESNLNGDGGGHEYLATEIIPAGTRLYGYRWPTLTIGCEQSWGEGVNGFGSEREPGRFFIPGDMAEELIIHRRGDVAVPEFL